MVGSRTTVLRRTSGTPFRVRTSSVTRLILWDLLGRIPHLGADASRVAESRIAALKPRDQLTAAAQGRKYVISPRVITPRPLIVGFSTTEDVIQSCKDLITSHFFAIESLPTVIAAHEGDHEGHLILRCAAIVVHTAMAILLRTLSEALAASQDRSIAPADDQDLSLVYRKRCRKSLKEAIKITRGLADPDFPFIDVAMAVRVYIIFTIHITEGVCSTGMLVPDPDDHGRAGPGGHHDGDQPREGTISTTFYPARFKESDHQKRSADDQGRTNSSTTSSVPS